jgi:hypothetical protein
MWPWAHAALGYLCYTLYLRVRLDHRPAGLPVVALGVGTQLPDLIDKPLAWYLDILPYGRSFAHSLLTGTLVLVVVALALRARGADRSATAFVIGYLAHLLGDAYGHVVGGNWADLAFLVWPALPIPNQATEIEGLVTHLQNIEGSPLFLFGLGLTAVGLALWIRDGLPGLRALVAFVLPDERGVRAKSD